LPRREGVVGHAIESIKKIQPPSRAVILFCGKELIHRVHRCGELEESQTSHKQRSLREMRGGGGESLTEYADVQVQFFNQMGRA